MNLSRLLLFKSILAQNLTYCTVGLSILQSEAKVDNEPRGFVENQLSSELGST